MCRHITNNRRKSALVAGGAGFIGSHLCHRLLADGYKVLCMDNLFTGRMENIRDLLANSDFEFLQHDVTEPFHHDNIAMVSTSPALLRPCPIREILSTRHGRRWKAR